MEIASEKEPTAVQINSLQELRIAAARAAIAGLYTCLVNDVVSSDFVVIVAPREMLTKGWLFDKLFCSDNNCKYFCYLQSK